jgi:hypothetical protein
MRERERVKANTHLFLHPSAISVSGRVEMK